MPPILAPSLLAANHARLAEGLEQVAAAGCSWVHLDIMDGHFVPNLSFGPATVAALRSESALFFDVHLMLDNAHRFIEPFAKSGADLITVHVEPYQDAAGILQRIEGLGCQRGISLNPNTPAELLLPFLHRIELALVMTVQPGFGGQAFRESCLEKIDFLARQRERLGLKFRIEVDGGVDLNSASRCRAVGADTFVCGTSFFRSADTAAFRTAIEQVD